MPVLRNAQGAIFRPVPYENEASFEKDVVALADQIFGSSSIYLDIKKQVGSGIVTIPDGYLIDVTKPDEPKLFVVENEIAKHDVFRHVGNQLLRFATSFDEARHTVRTFLMDGIKKNPPLLARLEAACRQSSIANIDAYLDRVTYTDFAGLVIIDEKTPELSRMLEKLRANVSVIELKAFETDAGERMFQFDTLYDDEEDVDEPELPAANAKTPEERAALRTRRRQRRASSDTIVVPAIEEGFQRVFLGHDQWQAVRISPAMMDRVKYIAVYRVQPIQAVTHIAKVKEIVPYKDTGKYQLIFDGHAEEINHVELGDMSPPRGPFYVRRDKLLNARKLADTLT